MYEPVSSVTLEMQHFTPLVCLQTYDTHTPPYTMLTAANKQAIKGGTIEPCLKRRRGRIEVS